MLGRRIDHPPSPTVARATPAMVTIERDAFLCDVPSTSRTLLFSDKAWVYKRHFVPDCYDCSVAQCLGRSVRDNQIQFIYPVLGSIFQESAALVLGSIVVAASLVTCF